MGAPFSWTVFKNGVPDPLAVPVILHYKTRGGASRSAPPLVSLGNGAWSINPTDDDRAIGIVLLVDNGLGSDRRYLCKALYGDSNSFIAWNLTNIDGTLYSGVGTPAFTLWNNATNGVGIVPSPTATPVVAPHLWQATPRLSDLAVGVGFQIANPSGATPAYLFGDLESVEAATIAALEASGCTIEQILDECRTLVAGSATSRDRTKRFIAHKSGQAFADSPISKTEAFEVVARQPTLTEAFGRFQVREGEFRMVVRIGQTPASGDDVRENLLQADISRLADILEAHTWRAGVQGVWYEGADINKDNPQWWMVELSFRVVYYGQIRT